MSEVVGASGKGWPWIASTFLKVQRHLTHGHQYKNNFSVADGLEANVMEPANRGTKRDSSGKVRWQVRGGEEMFVQPDVK